MAYTETTNISYGSRVGSSFKGIGTGFLLFIAGTALLWWNEGRAVKTDKMLNEAQGVTIEMENINKVDQELEGKLIHATGLATTTDSLDDTVNYAQVYKIVREEMATPSRLIEHVCGRIARRLLSDFDMIDAVEISMLKQNPPIGADCDGCGVELTLTR